jgi:hypothetical protein
MQKRGEFVNTHLFFAFVFPLQKHFFISIFFLSYLFISI